MNKCKLPHASDDARSVDASFEFEAQQQTQILRSLVCDLLKTNQELRDTNQQLLTANQELHATLLQATGARPPTPHRTTQETELEHHRNAS